MPLHLSASSRTVFRPTSQAGRFGVPSTSQLPSAEAAAPHSGMVAAGSS